MKSGEMILNCKELSYTYPGQSKVLKFPSFEVNKGETHLVLGNSGSGKTTLIHLLALLRPMQEGELLISGQDVSQLSGKALLEFRAQNTSVIHQSPHFVKSLSAFDNLKLAPYFAKTNIDQNEIISLAKSLNIEQLLNKKTEELSGGEQQRLSILRAIITKPKLIFADEPTSNLDDLNCERVLATMRNMAEKHEAALVIVTHDNRLKNLIPNQILLQ